MRAIPAEAMDMPLRNEPKGSRPECQVRPAGVQRHRRGGQTHSIEGRAACMGSSPLAGLMPIAPPGWLWVASIDSRKLSGTRPQFERIPS